MRMPVLFVGHGSPMNAIETNTFTSQWEALSAQIPRPKAILAVSAHWYTEGTRTHDAPHPKTVYDMYGFPPELYRVTYPAQGAPELARRTAGLLPVPAAIDNGWGYDHGAWSVLVHMYPQADIPVYQLSVDHSASAQEHFKMGQALSALREEGVLILGSGNVVHNLALVKWGMRGGYPWALTFDRYIRDCIMEGHFHKAVAYEEAGDAARLAFYTPDHYDPLLYVLGAAQPGEAVSVFNESCIMGALSMTGYLIGATV